MTFVWRSRHGHTVDVTRCRASVSERKGSYAWLHQHQCSRKAVCERVMNGETYGFCKMHDPEERARKDDVRRNAESQKWAQQEAAWKQERDDKRLRPIFEAALRQIADGHNDARSVAAEALSQMEIPHA